MNAPRSRFCGGHRAANESRQQGENGGRELGRAGSPCSTEASCILDLRTGQEESRTEIHVIWETSETGIQQNPSRHGLIFPEKPSQTEQFSTSPTSPWFAAKTPALPPPERAGGSPRLRFRHPGAQPPRRVSSALPGLFTRGLPPGGSCVAEAPGCVSAPWCAPVAAA
jgi:hypothetical protein